MTEELRFLEARVIRIIFANEESGWGVVEMESDSTKKFTAVGEFGAIEVGDEIRLGGRDEDHPRFGPRFRAETVQPITPRTLVGIERYLAGPRVEGIGPELARRLVETFGAQTLEVLDAEPERVAEVSGIGPKRASRIAETWAAERESRELRIFLAGHGVGPSLSARVEKNIGDQALASLRRDPYSLIGQVEGFGFRTADRVADGAEIRGAHPLRLAAGLDHVLRKARDEGHLALPGPRLLATARELLGVDEAALRQSLRARAKSGDLAIVAPVDASEESEHLVYLRGHLQLERDLAARMLEHAQGPDPLAFRLPHSLHAEFAGELSEEQIAAVETALKNKVCVITGGPGVGKTTVLRTLVRIWKDRRLEVALACPTGRAAKRLEEVSGLEASTIHRLLKFEGHTGRFQHGRDEPIKADIVVVDETSMVDLPLFGRLVEALPLGARLLLVGDADQLPSVGPGCVLADIIACERFPVARLTRVYRQAAGSRIVGFAHGILAGALESLDEAREGELVFLPVEDPVEGAQLAARLMVDELPGRDGLEDPEAVQILTPTRRGPAGAEELNRQVQERRRRGGAEIQAGQRSLGLGDRVMQIRNDYDRELFNGDCGRIVELDAKAKRIAVRFDGVDHAYRGPELDDLQLAWAITVHKSQGGEYPAVILPLFSHHHMLLARSVLYTAVTRARRRLIVLGQKQALERALARGDTGRRYTGFGRWLAGEVPQIWRPRDS
jgi:exodeoxyribonuclease V alpha subunit